jgi:phosphoglycerol transferase MdoB-like AlkP superfamily enzyme
LAVIVLIRILLDPWTAYIPKVPRILLHIISGLFVFYNIFLCVISLTFYAAVHSEIHWKDLVLAGDSHSRGLILSASIYFILVVSSTIVFSWLLQTPIYGVFGYASDLIVWPIGFVLRVLRKLFPSTSKYAEIPQQEAGFALEKGEDDDADFEDMETPIVYEKPKPPFFIRLLQALFITLRVKNALPKVDILIKAVMYCAALALLVASCVESSLRPDEATLTFISWTTAALPFIDLTSSSPVLKSIKPLYSQDLDNIWDNMTAMAAPADFDWLKDDMLLWGFEDWHHPKHTHYSSAADPMKISNLGQPVLDPLKDTLKDAPIKHVVLLFLESTRNDVFPIKKNGTIWNRLAETWPDHQLPQNVQDKIANLTPNANYITGDYDDGFKHDESAKKKRGGLRFTSAQTSATYTLKSLTGTLCGIPPLLSDFNSEYMSNFYQPCLPNIFNAMNVMERTDEPAGPYNTSQWQSYFFMTATNKYDNSDHLMMRFGYPEDHTIGTEYLRADSARHGPVKVPDTNYFGFEEDHLEAYIRDAFVSAEENNERVFLTHLTSTTHHQFVMPQSEEMVPLGNGIEDISKYTNTEGYVDKWLGKILNVLDEQGVANETLVVFVGDHGLSMPDNDVVSTYYNPSRANNHVPLVLSHPKLPAFDVNDPVSSLQIVPTILDMLIETNSLSSASKKVASSLIDTYEGQSMIRPQFTSNPETGEANWQFTVVNPGRCMLCIRDAREPDWHLIIPVIQNVEWQLTNIKDDPHEKDSIQEFGFTSFLKHVEKKYGIERAKWVEEAAFRTRWWFEENSKRWRYGIYTQPIRVD